MPYAPCPHPRAFPARRFPPAAAPAPGAGAGGAEGPLSLGGLDGAGGDEDGWDVRVVAERTEVNGGPTGAGVNEAEALKEQGNEAYRWGLGVERGAGGQATGHSLRRQGTLLPMSGSTALVRIRGWQYACSQPQIAPVAAVPSG